MLFIVAKGFYKGALSQSEKIISTICSFVAQSEG